MDLPERNRDGEKKDRTSPSLFVIHNVRKASDILFKTGGVRGRISRFGFYPDFENS